MDHPTGTGSPPVIATDALTKAYPGGVTALAGLTVTVAPGVTVGALVLAAFALKGETT
jgi:hypothetical protein